MIIHLLPEGYLETCVGGKLITACGHTLGTIYGSGRGYVYVRKLAAKLHPLATATSGVLILTDYRDSGAPCAPAALREYVLGSVPKPLPTFLCRFAVNELESWLMADREGLARYFSVSVSRLPREPEKETDPKQTLVNIARHSHKTRIKEGVAPPGGHLAKVGPEYSSLMREYIFNHWDIEAAAACAPSLDRCLRRLRELSRGL